MKIGVTFRVLVPLLLGWSLSRADSLFINYGLRDGLLTDLVKCVAIDANGYKWFGGKDQGAMKLDSTWTIFYQFQGGLNSFAVKNITIDSKGDVWFAGSDGVSRLSNTFWTTYTTADGLAGNNTYHVAQDQAGIYWIATEEGVSRFDGRVWTTFRRSPSGLGEDWVNYIFQARNGVIWFGLKTKGVTLYDGKTWETVNWIGGLDTVEVRVIRQDLQGDIWVGTRFQGVSKYDGERWTTYTKADGLAHNNVWGIAIDSSGNKWFATFGGGVSMFDGRHWITYNQKNDGLALNVVNDIAVARDGTLWIATDNGISVLKPENIKLPPVHSCDINGDQRLNISDAIALILLLRDKPGVLLADYNDDGRASLADVISLLNDLRNGACPPLSAALAADISPAQKLNPRDAEYVASLLKELELTPAEREEFRLALGRAAPGPTRPAAYALEANFPNPFNPSTAIRYSVPGAGAVPLSLQVFDIRGRLVHALAGGLRQPGEYTVFWDGRDTSGRPAASGVYFYRLQAPGFSATRKMILLK